MDPMDPTDKYFSYKKKKMDPVDPTDKYFSYKKKRWIQRISILVIKKKDGPMDPTEVF